jgi:hypothetical protein
MSIESTVLSGAVAMIKNAVSNLEVAEDHSQANVWEYERHLLLDAAATIQERIDELKDE